MRSAAVILLLVPVLTAVAQETTGTRHLHPPGSDLHAAHFVPESGEPADDPAYRLYRDGYELVLGERWTDARAKFQELARRFPGNPYADAAAYWSAFSLKQVDLQGAMDSYRDFVRTHPESAYLEDALADLSFLQAHHDRLLPRAPKPPVSLARGDLPIGAPNLRAMNNDLRRMERMVRTNMLQVRTHWRDLRGGTAQAQFDTVIRLAESPHDQAAFRKLRRVALDPSRHDVVRLKALEVLRGFRKTDVLSIFLDIARHDTAGNLRETAILNIVPAAGDREQALAALEGLYSEFPDQHTDIRLTVLDAIADVGTDRAAEFLARVARSTPDGDLQATAIGYLGMAGHDRKRSVEKLIALYPTLPGGASDARATALYALAELGTDRAVDFLIRVARTSPDPSLQQNAVTYLGNIGGEKVRRALREILRDRAR